jgi:hypothetical protein
MSKPQCYFISLTFINVSAIFFAATLGLLVGLYVNWPSMVNSGRIFCATGTLLPGFGIFLFRGRYEIAPWSQLPLESVRENQLTEIRIVKDGAHFRIDERRFAPFVNVRIKMNER